MKKKGTERKRRPGPGRTKVLPLDWERRAWSVRPWTLYAIGALALREGIPASVLVDRVLTAYCRRQRAVVPPAPRGVKGPGNGG
jgi:hypothetical protein